MDNIYNIDKSFIYSHLQIKNPKVDFHLHEGFEIFILISGDVKYFVEKKIYEMQFGDVIITNNHEIHKPTFQSDSLYERICIEFNPNLAKPFCTDSFDLLKCFTDRQNGEHNKFNLNRRQKDEVIGIANKIEFYFNHKQDGGEILALNYLIELLVYLNKIFMKTMTENDNLNIPQRLIPILNYIDNNLEGDLDLQTLEKIFFINRFYLSKLFKKCLGSNIHNYIIYKRISKAKLLLSQGRNVSETCVQCGFNDYANFLKMFKKTVGVTPGKYGKY